MNVLGIEVEDITTSSDDDLPSIPQPRRKRKPVARKHFIKETDSESDCYIEGATKETHSDPDCYIVFQPQNEPLPEKLKKEKLLLLLLFYLFVFVFLV